MDYNVELLAPAWRELDEIAQIHSSLVGPDSAERITTKILNAVELLRTSPFMGRVIDEPLIKSEDYRRIICDKYLCFYKVIGRNVYVYHIIDGRRDYPKLLADS